MRKALVEPTGRVAQVADEAFPVAPPLVWRDCPDEAVADLWIWDGAQFVLPPASDPKAPARAELEASDGGLVRVLEDVIEALGIESQLPAPARAKLARRRQLREGLSEP